MLVVLPEGVKGKLKGGTAQGSCRLNYVLTSKRQHWLKWVYSFVPQTSSVEHGEGIGTGRGTSGRKLGYTRAQMLLQEELLKVPYWKMNVRTWEVFAAQQSLMGWGKIASFNRSQNVTTKRNGDLGTRWKWNSVGFFAFVFLSSIWTAHCYGRLLAFTLGKLAFNALSLLSKMKVGPEYAPRKRSDYEDMLGGSSVLAWFEHDICGAAVFTGLFVESCFWVLCWFFSNHFFKAVIGKLRTFNSHRSICHVLLCHSPWSEGFHLFPAMHNQCKPQTPPCSRNAWFH